VLKSQDVYHKEVQKKIKEVYGVEADKDNFLTCPQNGTMQECPISKHTDAKEFLVVVHNQQIRDNNGFIRIKLPDQFYKAQSWDKRSMSFKDVYFDTLEQYRFN